MGQVLEIDEAKRGCKVRKFHHQRQLDRLFSSAKEKDSFVMHERELILTEFEEFVEFDTILT